MSLSKIKALGERSKSFHEKLGVDLDKVMSGYDELDKKKDAAVEAHLGYQGHVNADLENAKKDVEHLTNLPLTGSDDGGGH